jgi:hypothetical protein
MAGGIFNETFVAALQVLIRDILQPAVRQGCAAAAAVSRVSLRQVSTRDNSC